MNSEYAFRIAFWVLLLIFMIFNRIMPLILAKRRNEKIVPDKDAIKNEGKYAFAARVFFGMLFGAFLVLYAIYPSFMNYLQINIPNNYRLIGIGIAIFGESLWIYSQMILNRYWSPNLKIQTEHKVIREGIYKRIRHPIYLSMDIWCIGVAIFTANIFLIAFSIIAISMLSMRMPKEEKMLIGVFGNEYIEYMNETGKIFPKIKPNRKVE
jgi:protein-S-isoprenylcysteine O-methyltransferase Ste14